MPDIANNEPAELRAGLTWRWNRQDLSDYPAPTWTLKYAFKNAAQHIEITAAADGSYHAVTVAIATTATFVAGTYAWVAYVENGTERYEVDRGTLKVLPAYSNANALDDRTHAKKVLESIEAVLEGRATKDQEEYTIGDRSLKRTPLAALIKLRSKYAAEVASQEAAERIANGLPNKNRMLVRF